MPFLKLIFHILLLFLLGQSSAGAASFTATPLFSIKDGFNQPSDVAVSKKGDIYILDGVNGKVHVFNNKGELLFQIPEEGSNVRFNLPMSINIDKDRLFVADSMNHRISIFDSGGEHIKDIGLEAGGIKLEAPQPTGIALMDGDIFWSDRANHRICITEIDSGRTISCFGRQGGEGGELQYPFMLAFDRDDYLHVVDVLNGRIEYFNARGAYFGEISNFGIERGELFRPNGIAIDSEDNLFTSDSYSGRISTFNKGLFSGYVRSSSGDDLIFDTPVGIELVKNKLYVTDMTGNRIDVFKLSKDRSTPKVEDIKNSRSSGKGCITCHLSWQSSYTAKKDGKDELPVTSFKMCYSCHHGAVIDSRRSIGSGYQHPLQRDDKQHKKSRKRRDKISKDYLLNSDNDLYCGSCHTPHETGREDKGYSGKAKNRWLRSGEKGVGSCIGCHESAYAKSAEEARSKGIHPVRFNFAKPVLVGQRNVTEMDCLTCHVIHGGKEKTPALSQEYLNGELCISCHKEMGKMAGIDHDLRITSDKSKNSLEEAPEKAGLCGSCHSMHRSKAKAPFLYAGVMNIYSGDQSISKRDRLCMDCHTNKGAAEKKAIENFSHPYQDVVLRSSTSVMPLFNDRGEKSEFGTVYCVTCHNPHRWSPSKEVEDKKSENREGNVLNSFLRRKGAKGTFCVDCHGLETRIKYKYYHDRRGRDKELDYIK